jgi:hypothetical protein
MLSLAFINSVMFLRKEICSSFQIPRSPGDILPSGEMAVASVNTTDAPPIALVPR